MIAHVISIILGFLAITAGEPLGLSCANIGNSTTNSTYNANLELLSSTLPSNASPSQSLFAKGSVGAAPYTVYGLALCRGDTNASTCNSCVATAFQDVQKKCALYKGATIFYDPCLLSFSDTDFLTPSSGGTNGGFLILLNTRNFTVAFLPGWDPSNPGRTTDVIVGLLLYQTAKQAAYVSTMNYATVRMDFSSSTTFATLYSLAQCTPDLTPSECSECLDRISSLTTRYFSGKQGGRILGVRCNFRYEVYQFYQGNPVQLIGIVLPSTPGVSPPAPLGAVPSDQHNSKQNNLSLRLLSIY